jgi:hypothetical protein
MRAGQVRGQIIARVDPVKQLLPVACSEMSAPFAALSMTFAHPIPRQPAPEFLDRLHAKGRHPSLMSAVTAR